jgi:DOPA 4,5-dioxygenase
MKQMIPPNVTAYHVHIYCQVEEIPQCQQLRILMLKELGDQIAGAGPVRHRPIGPHPLPMFEAWFDAEHLAAVKDWCLKNHGNFSVLFHPLTGNAYEDHALYAEWMGPILPLDLSIF